MPPTLHRTRAWSTAVADKAAFLHSQTPLLKRLPLRAILIISLLIVVNLLVWAAVGITLHFNAFLTGPAVLAYTLGLRHALDADHISAIDLMTRRLVASGQKPVTVGTFFSLGHSTIVVITSIVVAATAAAVSERFDSFSRIGGIIGSSVSSAFLLILGLANLYILFTLSRRMHQMLKPLPQDVEDAAEQDRQMQDQMLKFEGGGCLFRSLKAGFKLIDRPWKMYPLGILFGLGFDTSSEVALLGISSLQAARGTSIWLILIFPVLFTAGMCLIDTIDGALMFSLYTSSFSARDPFTVLYYNIILTGLTVIVAIVIGVLQVLGLVLAVDEDLTGPFWDGVAAAQDSYDVIGGAVCATFLVVGVGSVLLYKPWRRWVDTRRKRSEASQGHFSPLQTHDDDRDGSSAEDAFARGGNKDGGSVVLAKPVAGGIEGMASSSRP